MKKKRIPSWRLQAVLSTLVLIQTLSCAAIPESLVLEGQWPGFRQGRATSLAISGNRAYVCLVGSGLHVFDVTDPTHPIRTGGFVGSWDFPRLKVAGKYAYIAAGVVFTPGPAPTAPGFVILDISDPANPKQVATYLQPVGSVEDVAVVSHYAYIVAQGCFEMEGP